MQFSFSTLVPSSFRSNLLATENKNQKTSNDPIHKIIQFQKTISSGPLSSDNLDKLETTIQGFLFPSLSTKACDDKPKPINSNLSHKTFIHDDLDMLDEALDDFLSSKSSTKAFPQNHACIDNHDNHNCSSLDISPIGDEDILMKQDTIIEDHESLAFLPFPPPCNNIMTQKFEIIATTLPSTLSSPHMDTILNDHDQKICV